MILGYIEVIFAGLAYFFTILLKCVDLFSSAHTQMHTAKSQLLSLTSRCCPQTSAIELLVLHRSEPRLWVSQVFQLLAQHELPLQALGV